MISLPLVQQKSLFQALIEKGAFDFFRQSSLTLDFIARIWDIDLMPSTDPRFKTMRADIQQHYINNADWDEHYMFSEILGIYNAADKFQKVIELIPSDKFQTSDPLIEDLVALINSYLLPHKQRLVSINRGGVITYEVRSNVGLDETTPKNKIRFFVEKERSRYWERILPPEFPAFVLVADNWDDFGMKSTFRLYYHSGKMSEDPEIGGVKIIMSAKEGEEERRRTTKEMLPDEFTELSSEFYSLGQEEAYYLNIKKRFPKHYRSIFWALKDCAIYPSIEERFEHEHYFKKSLLRENKAERLLRDAKFIIEGIQRTNREDFKYHFKAPFSDSDMVLDVKFDSDSPLPSRLFAIVGKNGVGKTQMMAHFPMDLAKKQQECFEPQLPLFSKVISVSTSPYDHCNYPDSSDEFNYKYIGLTREDGSARRIVTADEFDADLQEACELINDKGRATSLRSILVEILPKDMVESLFHQPYLDQYSLKASALKEARGKFSSGESTLLYIFMRVVSILRYDTLLLFDEPETHLHPNAITALISALYTLLEEFQSYAIVATHSPLVIRDIKSKHVRIMERFDDKVVIRKAQQETLGANVSVLVDEIFGNKDIPQYYREAISRLAEEGTTEEKIYQAINPERTSLPIGLQVYIKFVCSKK